MLVKQHRGIGNSIQAAFVLIVGQLRGLASRSSRETALRDILISSYNWNINIQRGKQITNKPHYNYKSTLCRCSLYNLNQVLTLFWLQKKLCVCFMRFSDSQFTISLRDAITFRHVSLSSLFIRLRIQHRTYVWQPSLLNFINQWNNIIWKISDGRVGHQEPRNQPKWLCSSGKKKKNKKLWLASHADYNLCVSGNASLAQVVLRVQKGSHAHRRNKKKTS